MSVKNEINDVDELIISRLIMISKYQLVLTESKSVRSLYQKLFM